MNIRRNTKAFWDTKLFWAADRISFAQTFDFISKWQNRWSRCRQTSDLISSGLDFRPTVPSLLFFHPWVRIKYHPKDFMSMEGMCNGMWETHVKLLFSDFTRKWSAALVAIINLQVLTGPCMISDKHGCNKSNQVLPQASSVCQQCRVKVRRRSKPVGTFHLWSSPYSSKLSFLCSKSENTSVFRVIRTDKNHFNQWQIEWRWIKRGKENKLTRNTASRKLHLVLEIKTFQVLRFRVN